MKDNDVFGSLGKFEYYVVVYEVPISTRRFLYLVDLHKFWCVPLKGWYCSNNFEV